MEAKLKALTGIFSSWSSSKSGDGENKTLESVFEFFLLEHEHGSSSNRDAGNS